MATAPKLTLATLADEALALFHAGERVSTHTGREIRVTDHESEPEWVRDLRFNAHRDPDGADMLPDDWRHEMIEDALRIYSEAADDDDAQQRADDYEAPIYNTTLLGWLASHLYRLTYCDEAFDEYGGDDLGMIGRMALGFYHEFRIVFASVGDSLRSELGRREEAED